MQALCRKISVAHDLDPEIQKELYGHMEDKLLAYVSGEEQVTEDDAFMLVREHFGDPAVLKGLLQDVHAYEAHVSLARRLAAAAAATLGAMFAFVVLFSLVSAVSGLVAALNGVGPPPAMVSPSGLPTGYAVARGSPLGLLVWALRDFGRPILMWLILLRWQRALKAGKRPWFLRWHPGAIAAALIGAFLMMKLLPGVTTVDLLLTWPPRWYYILRLYMAGPVLHCFVWLWWCDRPPRRVRTLAYVLCASAVFLPLFRLFSLPQFLVVLTASRAEQVPAALGTLVGQGQVLDSALNWYLALRSVAFRPIVLRGFWRTGIYAAAACAIYLLIMHLRRRYAKPSVADFPDSA